MSGILMGWVGEEGHSNSPYKLGYVLEEAGRVWEQA